MFRLLRVLRLSVLVKEYRRLFTSEGVRDAAVATAIAAFGGGALFSTLEKGYSVWDGVWLAVTTMSTVGYGDVSPQTTGGRLVAVRADLARELRGISMRLQEPEDVVRRVGPTKESSRAV